MSIEGQGHFFTIYFPGFVCFVLYLAKISGERLQDHWSSGLQYVNITFRNKRIKLGQNEVVFNRFLFYTEIDISITPCMVQMALLTRLEFWANQLEIIISAYIGGKHF